MLPFHDEKYEKTGRRFVVRSVGNATGPEIDKFEKFKLTCGPLGKAKPPLIEQCQDVPLSPEGTLMILGRSASYREQFTRCSKLGTGALGDYYGASSPAIGRSETISV